jgi:hypothetical protein
VDKGVRVPSIFFMLFATNIAGVLLRYFKLDTYLILLGFRFQLSLCLPFIIIFKKTEISFYKQLFKEPAVKKNFFFISLILLPVIILSAILLILNKIHFGDPEYFFEFGLSSIADFPVYLIWNSIQLIMFFSFLIIVSSNSKYKFSSTIFNIIILFAYMFIPLNGKIDYFELTSFLIYTIIIGIFILHFQNIYWIIFSAFSILWLNILLFGSNSEMMINLLFASRYHSWEGFFSTAKEFRNYLLPAQLLITLIFLLLNLGKKKEKLIVSF